jgi:hypothetical protein
MPRGRPPEPNVQNDPGEHQNSWGEAAMLPVVGLVHSLATIVFTRVIVEVIFVLTGGFGAGRKNFERHDLRFP